MEGQQLNRGYAGSCFFPTQPIYLPIVLPSLVLYRTPAMRILIRDQPSHLYRVPGLWDDGVFDLAILLKLSHIQSYNHAVPHNLLRIV